MKLTVIMRNDAPFQHMQASPIYRSVQIDLTEDQIKRLVPDKTGVILGRTTYEEFDKAFLEEEHIDRELLYPRDE